MGNSTVWEWLVVALLVMRAAGCDWVCEAEAADFEGLFLEGFLRGAG